MNAPKPLGIIFLSCKNCCTLQHVNDRLREQVIKLSDRYNCLEAKYNRELEVRKRLSKFSHRSCSSRLTTGLRRTVRGRTALVDLQSFIYSSFFLSRSSPRLRIPFFVCTT